MTIVLLNMKVELQSSGKHVNVVCDCVHSKHIFIYFFITKDQKKQNHEYLINCLYCGGYILFPPTVSIRILQIVTYIFLVVSVSII